MDTIKAKKYVIKNEEEVKNEQMDEEALDFLEVAELDYKMNELPADDRAAIKTLMMTASDVCKKHCKNGKSLSTEELIELKDMYDNGTPEQKREAQNIMVMSVTRFVYYVCAKNYPTYFTNEPADLINEGIAGIIANLHKYDPRKAKLTTFCFPLIKHEVTEFTKKGVSIHYTQTNKKIKEAAKSDATRTRNITLDEIAILSNASVKTITRAAEIMLYSQSGPSISDSEKEEDSASITLPSKQLTPEQQYIDNETNDYIRRMIEEHLTYEEQQVILYTYGFLHIVKDDPNEKKINTSKKICAEFKEEKFKTPSDRDIAAVTGIPVQKIKALRGSAFNKLESYIVNSQLTERYPRKSERQEIGIEILKSEREFRSEIEMYDFDSIFDDEEGMY